MNPSLIIITLVKVIYTKYSKHWPYKVWHAEKRTKPSSNILLGLVRFSAWQTLLLGVHFLTPVQSEFTRLWHNGLHATWSEDCWTDSSRYVCGVKKYPKNGFYIYYISLHSLRHWIFSLTFFSKYIDLYALNSLFDL